MQEEEVREQEVSLRLKSAFESLCIRVVSFEYALRTAVDILTLVITKTLCKGLQTCHLM